jgi:hypothetical protein
VISVRCSFIGSSPPLCHLVDDRGAYDADRDAGELEPVEQRETEKTGFIGIVKKSK